MRQEESSSEAPVPDAVPAGEPAAPPPVIATVRADDPAAVPTTIREAEVVEYNRDKDSGYSLRRMIFVFGMCGFMLISTTAFVGFGYVGELVSKYVESSFSLMGAIVLYYLAAGVLDRQEVLRRIGEGFRGRRDGRGDGDGPPR